MTGAPPVPVAGDVKFLAKSVWYIQRPLKPIFAAIERREIARACVSRIDNFSIYTEPAREPSHKASCDAIIAALDLVRELDVVRFARIKRYMPRIFVKQAMSAQFWISAGVCVIPAQDVLHRGRADLALSLVHESTHARIAAYGIPWHPRFQDRVERRCIQEQLAFTCLLGSAGFGVTDRAVWYEDRLNHERPRIR